MAWPTVIINILNMMRGPILGVEFHFLFVVYGTVAGTERNLIMVDNTTDFSDNTFDNIDYTHTHAKSCSVKWETELDCRCDRFKPIR